MTDKMNINNAEVKDLMAVKGIGRVTAKGIVDYRKAKGKIHCFEELLEVREVGSKLVKKLADHFKLRRSAGKNQILQLKIELEMIQPPIWRRIMVDKDRTFADLHRIIQAIMSWKNCHLHQFYLDQDITIGSSNNHFHPGANYDENEVKLSQFLDKPGDEAMYVYDFGDDWRHRISVEWLLPEDEDKEHPCCIGGSGTAPPEDVGGVPGFRHLQEVLDNPNHPEYEDYKNWLGDDSVGEDFSPEPVNHRLKNI